MTAARFDALLLDNVVEGSEASDLRSYIDEEYGDKDGIVTASEVSTYRAEEVARFNQQLDSPFAASLFSGIMVNARGVQKVEVIDIMLSDEAMGGVTATKAIHRDIAARLNFAGTTAARANVSFEQDFRIPFRIIEMEWGVAKFRGGGEWAIDPATTVPGGKENPFWDGEGFTVPYEESGDFSSEDEPARFDLVNTTKEDLDPRKKKDSPGVGVALVLGGVAALVAVARKSRLR